MPRLHGHTRVAYSGSMPHYRVDPDATHYLYRVWNAENELMYVGVTINVRQRFTMHRAAGWWPEGAQHTVEEFPNRADAEAAETAAIIAEVPKLNVIHSTVNKMRVTPQPEGTSDESRWDAKRCAEFWGVKVATWTGYVGRNQAPQAKGFDGHTGRRYWDAAEVQLQKPGAYRHKGKDE